MHFTNNARSKTIPSTRLLPFFLLNLFLFSSLLSPVALSAPTRVLLPDSTYAYRDTHLNLNALLHKRQDPSSGSPPSAATSASPAPAAPPPPTNTGAPAAPASTGTGSGSQIVTTIVQAVWPDVDPLIEQAVIYFASGIPSMISNLLSSWGV